MAFMLGKHLVFLDSFQFMASSLERLAANLPEEAYIYIYIYNLHGRELSSNK